jgi:hypothetical protein
MSKSLLTPEPAPCPNPEASAILAELVPAGELHFAGWETQGIEYKLRFSKPYPHLDHTFYPSHWHHSSSII